MKRIALTRGLVAKVDSVDFERVKDFKWHAGCDGGRCVARRWERGAHSRRRMILLHRYILGARAGQIVDHQDGDGLNCQRENMRLCTHAENGRNRKRSSNNSSGAKGVTFHKLTGKWQAQIMANGKQVYLGLFETVGLAAVAYGAAALRLHGAFARIK